MDNELYEKYYKDLFKWCLAKTRNYVDAEDLLQDISYQLIKSSSQNILIIDEERFIWKVAYYTWCKKVRDYNKQKKLVSLTNELENTIKDDIDILKQVETEEIKSILNNIIEKLDTKCKKCINLYYYEDLSIKEVADKLSMNESLVKYYLYQARNKIRSELEK